MTLVAFCRRAAIGLAGLVLVALPRVTPAQQYFGQNHTQYKHITWQLYETEHFVVHFYAEEKDAATIAAQTAERSYARLSRIFNHQFREKKPIIAFASRGDFAQNNVFGDLGEATGGVTDELRQRNMFFFAGDLKESEHVLAHEMVHQFQYDIFSRGRSGSGISAIAMVNPPLWFIEGMAEFLSIGPNHVATDAIMRDAAVNGNIPTIEQMTRRPDMYFPYRYGEALLAYVAKRWGDDVIGEIMQAVPASGVERSFQRHTGLKLDELGEEWKEALQVQHLPLIATRERARKFSQPILDERHTGGAAPIYVAPALSPDGRHIAFLSTGSFARAEVFLDLYIADATTGKRIKRLTKSTTNQEEELRSAYSQSAFSPDGKLLAYTTQREGKDVLTILDVKSLRMRARLDKTGLDQMIGPSFSPDGHQIVFSGTKGGFSDLYIIDSDGRNLRQLTTDQLGDHQPQWSPDGQKIAFASERGPDTDLSPNVLRFGPWRISILNLDSGDITTIPGQGGRNLNPMWAPDGQSLAFVSDRTGTPNIFLYDFAKGEHYQLTDVIGSVMSFTEQSPAISWAREADRMAYVYFNDDKYTVWAVDNPRQLKKLPFRVAPVAAAIVADGSAAVSPARPDVPRVALGSRATAFDSTGRRLSMYRIGSNMRSAGTIPDSPGSVGGIQSSVSVAALLDSAAFAIPDPATFKLRKYKPTLRAEYVSRPQVGYAQDNFGRGVFGGTTIVLADMLGNHQLAIAGAVNGRIDEAQVFIGFQSLANRFQYQTGFEQTPIFFLQDSRQESDVAGNVKFSTALARYIIRQGFFNGSYPLNRFSRFELGTSLNSIERSTEFLSAQYGVNGIGSTGYYVDSIVNRSTLVYGNPYAAYVFDNTLYGRTASPIFGRRMRFELGPTLGGVRWMHFGADYRRYDPIIFNYLTFATRFYSDVSIGRDEMEFPKYIGRPYYVRGYDREASQSQCGGGIAGGASTACTATQLLGSRVMLANAELRFPILSNAIFGPLPLAVPPVDGLFFYDIGTAWRGGRSCSSEEAVVRTDCGQDLHLTRPAGYDFNTQRYFLGSHGFGLRVNAFNIAIIRWDYAIPHDGPGKGKGYWVWTIGTSY